MAFILHGCSSGSDTQSTKSSWDWKARALRNQFLDGLADERHSNLHHDWYFRWCIWCAFLQPEYDVVKVFSKVALGCSTSSIGGYYHMSTDFNHLL